MSVRLPIDREVIRTRLAKQRLVLLQQIRNHETESKAKKLKIAEEYAKAFAKYHATLRAAGKKLSAMSAEELEKVFVPKKNHYGDTHLCRLRRALGIPEEQPRPEHYNPEHELRDLKNHLRSVEARIQSLDMTTAKSVRFLPDELEAFVQGR